MINLLVGLLVVGPFFAVGWFFGQNALFFTIFGVFSLFTVYVIGWFIMNIVLEDWKHGRK